MTQKQHSSTQKYKAMLGLGRSVVVCILCFCLSAAGAAANPSVADPSPSPLFAEHGIFEGTITRQSGGNALGTPQRRTRPLSLPPGTYRVLLDIQTFSDPHSSTGASLKNPVGPPCDAFLRLPSPGVDPSQVPQVHGFSVAAQAARLGGVITLTRPFQGDAEYGAGGFGRQEAWFTIVPAQDTNFVPFGFGGVPEALPRGAAHAARKDLTAEMAGDIYFLRLPAGASRVSLEVTASAGTPLPPGASSGGMDGGFGAAGGAGLGGGVEGSGAGVGTGPVSATEHRAWGLSAVCGLA